MPLRVWQPDPVSEIKRPIIATQRRISPTILGSCSGHTISQRRQWSNITLFRTERPKTTPCPAARPLIDHIRKWPSALPEKNYPSNAAVLSSSVKGQFIEVSLKFLVFLHVFVPFVIPKQKHVFVTTLVLTSMHRMPSLIFVSLFVWYQILPWHFFKSSKSLPYSTPLYRHKKNKMLHFLFRFYLSLKNDAVKTFLSIQIPTFVLEWLVLYLHWKLNGRHRKKGERNRYWAGHTKKSRTLKLLWKWRTVYLQVDIIVGHVLYDS